MNNFILENLIDWYQVNIAAEKLLLLSTELRKSVLEGLKRGAEQIEKSQ